MCVVVAGVVGADRKLHRLAGGGDVVSASSSAPAPPSVYSRTATTVQRAASTSRRSERSREELLCRARTRLRRGDLGARSPVLEEHARSDPAVRRGARLITEEGR